MRKLKYLIGFMLIPCCMFLFSCDESYPKGSDSPYETVLLSIKILNGGADGATVYEGKIDEKNKTVWFPKIELETDFSKLKVEVTVSEGADIETNMYDFSMASDEPTKSLLLRVINHTRYRDYILQVRKKIPPTGVSLDDVKVYDYSAASTNGAYPSFAGAVTRGSGFDGEHVLIVHRTAPHLLAFEDLKKGIVTPKNLDLTGVVGGTFIMNLGTVINGHVYIATLSGATVSPLKIYHWNADNPGAAPDVLFSSTSVEGRQGDNMSVALDDNGNGYIYMSDNIVTNIVRFKVTNYTTLDPVFRLLPSIAGMSAFNNVSRIGNSSEYLFTAHDIPIMLVDEAIAVDYTMGRTSVPIRGLDPRILTFNNHRYLMMCTGARGGSDTAILYLYNINRGETVKEALEIFEAQSGTERTATYEYSLNGSINTSPSTQTGYYIEKDEDGNDAKLYLYAATVNTGFVISEFTVAVDKEE